MTVVLVIFMSVDEGINVSMYGRSMNKDAKCIELFQQISKFHGQYLLCVSCQGLKCIKLDHRSECFDVSIDSLIESTEMFGSHKM